MPATIAASASNAAVAHGPAHSRAVLPQGLELLWQLRIAHLIRVKVHDRDTHSVFHFAFAKTRAGAAANVRILLNLRRRAWRQECVRHLRKP